MKNLHLAVIVAVILWTTAVDCKTQRLQHQLKKATTHIKPTKGPKSVLEAFKELSNDDFEFIKQIDKQFKQYGDNVKIKIQKENRTTSKNIKRTIDGSLGYGYQNRNDQQSLYSFSKPKYEIYPYSQHDIPPSSEYQQNQHHLHYLRNYPTALIESDPNYFRKQVTNELRSNGQTSVEIQPSHSYEIKQTEHGYRTIYHGDGNGGHAQEYNAQSGEGESVPVIVLRVPGAAKYASHLQVLLQQYLEARAAQYIQTFQEQEAHGIDASQQQIHDQEQPEISGYGALPVLPYGQSQAYLPAQMYIQPLQSIQPYFAQSLQNPYANAHIAQPIEVSAEHIAATPAPASYYTPSAHSDESADQHPGIVHPTAYEYHNVHSEQQHHNEHDTRTNEEIVYGHPHHESVSEHNGLLTTENFPDDKHTQVIFKSSTEHTPYQPSYQQHSDEQYSHPLPQQYLPQTHVASYRAPLVYHKLEEQFYNPHDDQGDSEQYSHGGYDYNAQQIGPTTPYASTVSITQRPAILPHNYHAQYPQLGNNHYSDDLGYDYASTEASEDDTLYKRNSNKKRRQSVQNRDDQVKKFKNVANRMKSRKNAAAAAAAKQTEST